MFGYVLRRVLMALVTIFVIVSLSFWMIRLMPGNPMEFLEFQLRQQGNVSPDQIRQQVQAIYGVMPTGPIWQQYLTYVGNIFRGDFGQSLLNPGQSVLSIITTALPWTLVLVGISLIISFAIGTAVGTQIAAHPDKLLSKIVTGVVSFLSSVPHYLIAIVAIYLLADLHHIFPITGAYSNNVTPGPNLPFMASVVYHATLPIACYVITSFAGWALNMKGSVTNILGADYVRAAESRGLSDHRVTQTYIGRNAMLPMVTSLALALGGMFGGSVFIETYFSYPGLGFKLISAVNSRDYSLMMGCFILITTAVVFANLIVDLLYPLIDPRIVKPVSRRKRPVRPLPIAPGTGPTVATKA
ncbi:ABC transporter permease [Microlunatus soli]|uniref:Peptide/nickel transport system permease protein n=1 Tax=Microlunatus soli TaxID=630515 RepID=A0A1H1WWD7_9ACTN|nr:ABC transporter permease [Microlunatus soli]SDT01405.1 peptide/nickel transport system permease protein [Microlunatus soli]